MGKNYLKKVAIWLKTYFWTWNSGKLKKPRALTLVKLLKVATGSHFQDSKFMFSLKHPRLSLVSFYAAGPFVTFSGYMNLVLAFGNIFAVRTFFWKYCVKSQMQIQKYCGLQILLVFFSNPRIFWWMMGKKLDGNSGPTTNPSK